MFLQTEGPFECEVPHKDCWGLTLGERCRRLAFDEGAVDIQTLLV